MLTALWRDVPPDCRHATQLLESRRDLAGEWILPGLTALARPHAQLIVATSLVTIVRGACMSFPIFIKLAEPLFAICYCSRNNKINRIINPEHC